MKRFLYIFLSFLVGILILIWVNKGSAPPKKIHKFPSDWFYAQRAYPKGQINHDVYVQTLKDAKNLRAANKEDKVWDFAGPLNTGGRLSDVEFHPCDEDIFLGAASGGIFKYSLENNTYTSIFDESLSLSIGDIAIAPSDCNVMYAGTGEANCGGGSQTYDGIGVYRSDDKGTTWTFSGLEGSGNIGRIAVHPQNPDIVYVAAMGNLFGDTPERGVYRSVNGGQTWENILFISDSTGAIDLVINPDSPEILYAAMWERIRRPDRRSYGGPTCGIYKSIDGGDIWTELTTDLPSPANDVGRIGIDISKSDPNILYAIYADKTGYFLGVYKTFDGGESWIQTNDGALNNCFQSYGWWFGRIKIDPVSPSTVYVIGFDLYKTTSGGNAWQNISGPEDVHVDQHELIVDPGNSDILYLGNDGGFYISDNGGQTWEWLDIFPITQFYTCEIDEQYPERLYGGTQDNGTNRTLTGEPDDWERIYGGDGFYVLVDPENNNYVYAEYQYGNFARSTNGGNSFIPAMNGISNSDRKNWNTPVVFDPTDPEILYYGSNKLYRSTNRAASWNVISSDLTNGPGINLAYGTITTIAVSPVNPEIVYVGTDDGNVWVSASNGADWELINSGLPDRWVTRLHADPVEENTVYVTFSGYRWDEYLPHIFRSEDKGQNWSVIASNLPESPLNDVIVDPENNQKIYVASDVGVFKSNDKGTSWNIMGTNLPLVPVTDIELHNDSRLLIAATYGRSMYSYDLFQDTITTGYSTIQAKPAIFDILVFPNPYKIQSQLEINLSRNSYIRIKLLTIEGKQIASVFEGYLKQGQTSLELNSSLFTGCKPGIFLLVAENEHEATVEKILYPGNP